ncbi:Rv2175c family DNA-binding protein [Corynebacterium lizhenjunii]|uniref:Rv2175c family DNA-binding protein n=1 Tax=Corynebacterium lizhenjunii TaxID=2709394 RepID=UPI0013EA2F79|nr:Rv2175c family DNA-binding protein [Corynebacterium lizhenjunii]
MVVSVTNQAPNTPDVNELLANEEMLTLPDVAAKLGIAVTRVHDLLHARKILAWRNAAGIRQVPAAFFNDKDAVSKYVSGCITVLSDGGYSDAEIFAHLFSEDDSLPGRPIDALHGHLAREVIRRAQAAAF